MKNNIFQMVLVFTMLAIFSSVAHSDEYVPPPPDSYKGNKWEWERDYKRCLRKPTEWARNRCIRNLYEGN